MSVLQQQLTCYWDLDVNDRFDLLDPLPPRHQLRQSVTEIDEQDLLESPSPPRQQGPLITEIHTSAVAAPLPIVVCKCCHTESANIATQTPAVIPTGRRTTRSNRVLDPSPAPLTTPPRTGGFHTPAKATQKNARSSLSVPSSGRTSSKRKRKGRRGLIRRRRRKSLTTPPTMIDKFSPKREQNIADSENVLDVLDITTANIPWNDYPHPTKKNQMLPGRKSLPMAVWMYIC